MKNYSEFQDYINMLAADFKDSGYKYAEDFAHECADGSEYVIYYSKAWELVSIVREGNYDLYSEGSEHASDCQGDYSDLDTQMTSVAYWIIFTSVMQAVIKLALTEE